MLYKRKQHTIEATPYTKGMEHGVIAMDRLNAEQQGLKDVYDSYSPFISPKSGAEGMINNNRTVEIPYLNTPRGREYIAKTDMIVTWNNAQFPMPIEQFNQEYEEVKTIITL